MKSIILNTARVDNSGKRRPAGEEVAIGPGKTQISAEAARSLVASGMAAEVKASPTDKTD